MNDGDRGEASGEALARWASLTGSLSLVAFIVTVAACDGGETASPDGGAGDAWTGEDGGADGSEDGMPADGADDGGADSGGDGGGGMFLEDVGFVATSVTFSADRLCDLDGDGEEDNAFAELGGSGSVSGTMLWNALAEAALGDGYGPGLFFPVLDEGGSSTLMAFSGDGTALGAVLRAPYESMDHCGEPVFYYEGEIVADGRLSLTAEAHPVLLSDAVAAGAARLTGIVREGTRGLTIETEECLAPTIATLGAARGPTQTRQMTLLEVLLAGGSVLGMAGTPGLSPDLDLDGDGLERLILDGDGRILQCVDGDDTVIDGRDCWTDERMADGFALARRVTYEQTSFAGRFEGWMGYCAGGYPDPSLFGSQWNATGRRRLAVGRSHACLREGDGTIRCWGSGGFGQLGYGRTGDIGDDEPACAAGFVDVGEGTLGIMASGDLTCAILPERRVKCWGRLGVGLPVIGDDETPAEAPTFELGAPVQQIVAGLAHFCALLSGGRVRCWLRDPYATILGIGDDCDELSPDSWIASEGGTAPADCGTLGLGDRGSISLEQAPASPDIPVGGRVVALASGRGHVCALLDDGAVRCWGRGAEGALGYGNSDNVGDDETPDAVGDVPLGGPAIAISAGEWHTCAVLEGGGVRCWGHGETGALGYGNQDSVGDDEAPAEVGDVPLGAPAVAVVAGEEHTCALLTEGRVRCWGEAASGQLGYGNEDDIGDDELPESAGDVPVGAPVTALSAGRRSTCAIVEGDEVRCWGSGATGYGTYGSIGDDETPESVGDVPLGCDPAVCGDGRREAFDECDDGNVDDGDGCDGTCRIEEGYRCAGWEPSLCHEVVCGDGIREGGESCDDANSVDGDGCDASCMEEVGYYCDLGTEPTECHEIVCGDGLVDDYEGCDDGNVADSDGCASICQVEMGFVCEWGSEPSVCRPTICGDGLREGSERCDDGNTAAGDGCDASCFFEEGFVCLGSPSACHVVVCGDGVVESDEVCDDGNLAASDGCSPSCRVELGFLCDGDDPTTCYATVCGDGLAEGEEACDDGNVAPSDGCSPSCQVEEGFYCEDDEPSLCLEVVCGDSLVVGPEECDDGNLAAFDGCSPSCMVELGFACDSGEPSRCREAICGDGGYDYPEECDDGNDIEGDGCDAECQLEPGFTCKSYLAPRIPSECHELVCGNGFVDRGEECDDGNLDSFDGCSPSCWIENGFACTLGEPTACYPTICGDGRVHGVRECEDWNVDSGDGCSPDCVEEEGWVCTSPGVRSECVQYCSGGYPVLTPGVRAVGTTTGAPRNVEGTCDGRGAEVIYQLEVPALSDVTISTDFANTVADTVLHVRSECGVPQTEIACNDDGGQMDRRSLVRLPSLPPGTYYVFVDSDYESDEGPFEILATVTPL